MGRTLTKKGIATRNRIIDAASALMLTNGVARTTIEDIQLAAHVSASQMYHYFADKGALVTAVIDRQSEQVLGANHQVLDQLDSFTALRKWRDMVVGVVKKLHCVGGCPLGSLASDLAETDPIARARLANSFAQWEEMLRSGFTAMRERGELGRKADPDSLAVAMLAAIQGGLLLSQVRRDATPIEVALDTMIAHLRTL